MKSELDAACEVVENDLSTLSVSEFRRRYAETASSSLVPKVSPMRLVRLVRWLWVLPMRLVGLARWLWVLRERREKPI